MDVHENSEPAIFLENFVNTFNPIGHKGFFLSLKDVELLSNSGFVRIETKHLYCKWEFLSYMQMYEYFINLFGLDKLDKNLTLYKELNKIFSIKRIRGKLILNWRLFMITAHKGS